MKMYYYYLEGKKIVRTTSVQIWGLAFEKNRIIEQTTIGDAFVSTVFLGVDYNFMQGKGHKPILFETMIFGGVANDFQERYETYEQAEQGHQKACEMVLGMLNLETEMMKKSVLKAVINSLN